MSSEMASASAEEGERRDAEDDQRAGANERAEGGGAAAKRVVRRRKSERSPRGRARARTSAGEEVRGGAHLERHHRDLLRDRQRVQDDAGEAAGDDAPVQHEVLEERVVVAGCPGTAGAWGEGGREAAGGGSQEAVRRRPSGRRNDARAPRTGGLDAHR